MIPISAATLAGASGAGTIASGTAGGNMTTEWGTGFITPGNQTNDPTQFRAWRQLWVENGTDKDLDFAIIFPITSNRADTILATTKQYLLLKLPPSERWVWQFDKGDGMAGPVYVRGNSAAPTTGGLRYGGFAE